MARGTFAELGQHLLWLKAREKKAMQRRDKVGRIGLGSDMDPNIWECYRGIAHTWHDEAARSVLNARLA
jgi:hypothetical protein